MKKTKALILSLLLLTGIGAQAKMVVDVWYFT